MHAIDSQPVYLAVFFLWMVWELQPVQRPGFCFVLSVMMAFITIVCIQTISHMSFFPFNNALQRTSTLDSSIVPVAQIQRLARLSASRARSSPGYSGSSQSRKRKKVSNGDTWIPFIPNLVEKRGKLFRVTL